MSGLNIWKCKSICFEDENACGLIDRGLLTCGWHHRFDHVRDYRKRRAFCGARLAMHFVPGEPYDLCTPDLLVLWPILA